MKVELTTEISVDDLVQELVQKANNKDLIHLIKEIDDKVAEWDFTLELIEHFEGLKKQYEEVQKLEQEEARKLLETALPPIEKLQNPYKKVK